MTNTIPSSDSNPPADVTFLKSFDGAVNDLHEGVQVFLEEGPTKRELAQAVIDLYRLRDTLSLVYSELSGALLQQMERNELIALADDSVIERAENKSRKAWQHEPLAKTVAHRIESQSMDWETGEVLLTPTQMITALLDYAHVDYWRVKALKAIDLDADAYCDSGEATPSLIVRPTKEH